uniref:RIIa domain-containing protein n=1 Tax=Strombidium inclinatum TaxID=197538 RepID=A0A7S3IY17_9SPIT|mmetsp:Transcript_5708/g.9059  ORF Transcript_5708/g.9059 Transcript_5708/m.9059 type:complete len:129 (+) Transcript_5708:11-397(+)
MDEQELEGSQQMEGEYSAMEGEGYGDESAADDDIFKNNHDLIGIQGILRAQKNEIEKKKLELRMENERYFRAHPEIKGLLQLFVSRILDDRPDSVLEYAGTFFDSASLRDVVLQYMKKEEEAENLKAQ